MIKVQGRATAFVFDKIHDYNNDNILRKKKFRINKKSRLAKIKIIYRSSVHSIGKFEQICNLV